MAFGDFGFPQVLLDLELTSDEADLFSMVEAVRTRVDFAEMLSAGAALALAINPRRRSRSS